MDFLKRIISNKHNIRIYTLNCPDVTNKILDNHQLSTTPTVALAQTIQAAILTSSTLKLESPQNLTFKIGGSGELKNITVQVDALGNVRGFTSPKVLQSDIEQTTQSVAKAIGASMISVVKDLEMKTPYTTHSPVLSDDFAQNLAYYFNNSEQTPSAVLLALDFDEHGKVSVSGGILIQTFPDTAEKTISLLEDNIKKMPKSLKEYLKEEDGFEDALLAITNDKDLEEFTTQPLQASCTCNKKRIGNLLKTIDRKELKKIIAEDHGAELNCQFCSQKYYFSEEDLKSLL